MKPRTKLPKYQIGAHFLTAKTFQNTPFFSDPTCALIFCEELEAARRSYGFHVLAFVVMPDHIHLLLWWDADALPDLTISKVAWAVKGLSARGMVAYLKGVGEGTAGVGEGIAFTHPLLQPAREPADRPHYRNWRYKVWQQGAGYDFNVYTPRKLMEKVAYIHANPVRAGLATRPEEYPWSSAVNYAAGVSRRHCLRPPRPPHPPGANHTFL
ncbi:MAG: REP-associated tyrosine transposase [Anaerolineae bacterium]